MRIRATIKYLLLIPYRILFLPRIYRRLVKLENKQNEPSIPLDEFYIAQTMMKSLAANLREFSRDSAQIREKQKELDNLIASYQIPSDEFYIAQTMVKSLAANLREFSRDLAQIREKQKELDNLIASYQINLKK